MSFLTELRHDDLLRLRASVKRIYMARYPKHMITDREADRVIEALGPEAAEACVRRAVDTGVVESRRGVVQKWNHG